MKTQQRKLIAAMSLCAAIVPNLASAVAISGQGTWETTLQGRDLDGNLSTFEAYYDTALNITWLADANYAMTSGGYYADGRMTWDTANTWAASLDFNGITGWRLPTTVDVGNDGATYINNYQGVDYGYNMTTHSEMSHMFYVTLGDKALCSAAGNCSQSDYGLTNTGPFSNVQRDFYWSATEYAPSTSYAWVFFTDFGSQVHRYKAYDYYAWAVHAGDVGTAMPSAVPVPAAAWLFGSGLLGLVGVARRKRMS